MRTWGKSVGKCLFERSGVSGSGSGRGVDSRAVAASPKMRGVRRLIPCRNTLLLLKKVRINLLEREGGRGGDAQIVIKHVFRGLVSADEDADAAAAEVV